MPNPPSSHHSLVMHLRNHYNYLEMKVFNLIYGIAIGIIVFILFVCLNLVESKETYTKVILITIDTVRADHIGCYGYEKRITPNIDYLCAKGVIFDNTITTAPITLPAHASILTGKYPHKIKVRNNGHYMLPNNSTTLSTELKKAGYKTAAFVSAAVLLSAFNLNQGFDLYNDTLNKRKLATGDFSERDAESVTNTAIDWMQKEINSKYFIWIHYFDPHAAYNPPEPYKTKYKDNLYDGEISYMDSQIGRLINFIEQQAKRDNKFLVILIADHGEGLWEHGEPEHGIFLYQATLKVPFIISSFPNITKGIRIKHLVRIIDVFPTILDYLHIKIPKDIDGISLIPLIEGKEQKKFAELVAFSETLIPEEYFGWNRLYSIQNQRWKIIHAPKMEVYDLKKDTNEKNNVFNESQIKEVKKLYDALKRFIDEQSKDDKNINTIFNTETNEKLKSLGYVGFPTKYEKSLPDPKDKLNIITKMYDAGNKYLQGQYLEAIQLMEEVLAENPTNRQVLFFLTEIYSSIGNADKAIQYALKNIELGDETGALHYNLGNIYYHLRKYKMAKEFYMKTYEINSNMLQALRMLAYISYQERDYEASKNYLLIVLEKNKNDDNAYYMLGAIEAENNNIKLAADYFQHAININPKNVEAWKNVAKAQRMLKNYGKAIEILLKGIEVNPSEADFYYEIGSIYYYDLKNYKEAIYYFNKTIEISPNHKESYMIKQLISAAETEIKK